MTINLLGANSRGADMTESQDDKYNTHNDHIDLLADSVNDIVTLNVGFASGSGSYTLSAEDYTGNGVLRFISDVSPSIDADWTLLLPATKRRIAIINETGFVVTVRSNASPGNSRDIVDGSMADIYNDGENIYELKRDIYDLGAFNNTWTFGAIFFAYVAVRNILLPANLPDSQAYCWNPADAGEDDRITSLQVNDVEQGTVTFQATQNDGTISFASDVTLTPGDRLTFVNVDPSPTETTILGDVFIGLKGVAL